MEDREAKGGGARPFTLLTSEDYGAGAGEDTGMKSGWLWGKLGPTVFTEGAAGLWWAGAGYVWGAVPGLCHPPQG